MVRINIRPNSDEVKRNENGPRGMTQAQGRGPCRIPAQPLVPPEELQLWFEWAGSKLLALRVKSPAPAGPQSCWPDYADEPNQAYGYTGERVRPAIPRAAEINLMDQIFELTALISEPHIRRIIHARSLVTPVLGRHLYSWPKIALMLHCNKQTAARYYFNGLAQIGRRISAEKVDALRTHYKNLTF